MIPRLEDRLQVRHRPMGRAVMHQQWADLLFLHWRYEASKIQSLLPQGLHVDTHDGSAWLGVVPFSMNRIRPSYLPPVPGISWFLELNVRTYVYDDAGQPGVWFFSLDCNQPLAVSLAQQYFHLPYEHATMSLQKQHRSLFYQCQRDREPRKIASYGYEVCETGKEAIPGSLEFFLLERYRLFSVNSKGLLHSGLVHHRPYRFVESSCDPISLLPLEWDGFTVEGDPASILTAEPVDVEIFPLRSAL